MIRNNIERYFYLHGITSPVIRHLLTTQTIVTGISGLVSLCTFWYTLWPLAFFIGAAITTVNFWHITKFVMQFITPKAESGISLRYFALFLLRFFITGVVLFFAIFIIKAPIIPLLFGLIVSIATIILWGAVFTNKGSA